MPKYVSTLSQRVTEAITIAEAGDMARTMSERISPLRRAWPVSKVELLYEFSYLRFFLEWERFLEETFVRYLCGYQSVHGVCHIIRGHYFGTVIAAERAILGSRNFTLWHDPTKVITRSQKFFNNGFHEVVVNSNIARLLDLAAVRHRVVHDHNDSRTKFDQATLNFVGRRYPGSRPGRFLREWDQSVTPPRRWLETLGTELVNMARQIA
jgi:hypothetical protein